MNIVTLLNVCFSNIWDSNGARPESNPENRILWHSLVDS